MLAHVPTCLPFPGPDPAEATLDRAIGAYLHHLQRRALRDKLNREHCANVNRTLRSFAAAWRIAFADGRQAILPASLDVETTRGRFARRPPPRTAGDLAEAVRWAAELLPGPACAADGWRNGSTRIAEAVTDDLDLWLLANPQWRSQNAQANACAALLNCFGWYDDTTGTRSPYRRRLAPKFVRETRRNATLQEYDSMTGPGCCTLMRIALWCLWHVDGMRPTELYDLRWPHVHDRGPEASTLEVPHKTQRYTGQLKAIPLTPATYAFFVGLRNERTDDVVFHNTRGEPWNRNSFDHHFQRRRESLRLADDLTPYTFRHAFATDAVVARAAKADVAVLLGHRGTRTLDNVYSKAEVQAEYLCRVARDVEAKVEQLRQSRRAQLNRS